MELYKRLPKELKNIILEYDGSIKYRKGKYINQISHNDVRYELIKKVIQPSIFFENDAIRVEIDYPRKYTQTICIKETEIYYTFYVFDIPNDTITYVEYIRK